MKPIRGYLPHEMLYADRRMMKWKGMLLSDHTEHINDYSHVLVDGFRCADQLDVQERERLDELIWKSYYFKETITLEIRGEEHLIEGKIEAILESYLVIESENGSVKVKWCDISTVIE